MAAWEVRQKPAPKSTYNMTVQQIQLILKEWPERTLKHMAYIWGKEKTSSKRVKWQSCDLAGPKPFPCPSSQAGGREMEQGASRSPGMLNTYPWRSALGAQTHIAWCSGDCLGWKARTGIIPRETEILDACGEQVPTTGCSGTKERWALWKTSQ